MLKIFAVVLTTFIFQASVHGVDQIMIGYRRQPVVTPPRR